MFPFPNCWQFLLVESACLSINELLWHVDWIQTLNQAVFLRIHFGVFFLLNGINVQYFASEFDEVPGMTWHETNSPMIDILCCFFISNKVYCALITTGIEHCEYPEPRKLHSPGHLISRHPLYTIKLLGFKIGRPFFLSPAFSRSSNI